MNNNYLIGKIVFKLKKMIKNKYKKIFILQNNFQMLYKNFTIKFNYKNKDLMQNAKYLILLKTIQQLNKK